MVASSVVNSESLDELGQCFFGHQYSRSLKTALASHGFGTIPVYSNILIDLDEIISNFAVLKMDNGKIKVKLSSSNQLFRWFVKLMRSRLTVN